MYMYFAPTRPTTFYIHLLSTHVRVYAVYMYMCMTGYMYKCACKVVCEPAHVCLNVCVAGYSRIHTLEFVLVHHTWEPMLCPASWANVRADTLAGMRWP